MLSLSIGCLLPEARAYNIQPDSTRAAEEEDSVLIQGRDMPELVVTHENVKRRGNQDLITITRAMRSGAANTGELLGRIPGLTYNRWSKALQYQGSGNVKILVDSLEKDADYIKQLRHNRFDRVDVTHKPTGIYQGYDVLINLHTKPHYEGYEVGLSGDVKAAPGNVNGPGRLAENTNARAQATFTKDKINVAIIGSQNWGRQGRPGQWAREYPLNGLTESTVGTDKDPLTSDNYSRYWQARADIDWSLAQGQVLSGVFSWDSQNQDGRDTHSVVTTRTGQLPSAPVTYTSYSGTKNNANKMAMANYQLRRKAVQATAQVYYRDQSYDSYKENGRSTGYRFSDDRRMTYRTTGGYAFFCYNDPGQKWQATATYIMLHTDYRQHRIGTDQLLAKTVETQHTGRLTWSWFLKRNMSVGAHAGLNYTHSKDIANGTFNCVTPRYGAFFWFRHGSKMQLSLNYNVSMGSPGLYYKVDYGQFTDSLTYQQGNPELKNITVHNLSLSVNLFQKVNVFAGYTHSANYVVNLASAGYGLRPDNIEGPYVHYEGQNANWSQWRAGANVHLGFGQKWRLDASALISGNRNWYKDLHHAKVSPSGSVQGMYTEPRTSITFYGAYNIQSAANAQVQGWTDGTSDQFTLGAQKPFFNNRLYVSLQYVPPVHFARGATVSHFQSPAFVQRAAANYTRFVNNNIELSFNYTLSGGKQVRNVRKVDNVRI